MTRPRVPVASSPVGALPGYYFGDAWFVAQDAPGRRVLMHGGQGMAFASLLLIRPQDELVAAFVASGTYLDGRGGLDLMAVLSGNRAGQRANSAASVRPLLSTNASQVAAA